MSQNYRNDLIKAYAELELMRLGVGHAAKSGQIVDIVNTLVADHDAGNRHEVTREYVGWRVEQMREAKPYLFTVPEKAPSGLPAGSETWSPVQKMAYARRHRC